MRIRDLDARCRVMAHGPAATSQELSLLQERFPQVPNGYLELSSDVSEIELDFQGKYLRIWHPNTCAEMDDDYEISKRLSGAIPIGDDGGGRVLLFFDGKSGPGLYRAGYGDLDPEDAVWVARDLEALLSTGTGMENL